MTAPVTLVEFPFRSDAEIAKARLAADGITSAIRADNEGGLNPGFYRDYAVRVVVREADLSDALESLGIERVAVPRQIAEAMYNHAMFMMPLEACGLVAVDDEGNPVFVACLTNAVASERRFVLQPVEHFGMLNLSERLGWNIGGVFHSHTTSGAFPSSADIEGGADPRWLHFIIGPIAGGKTELRAFRFAEGDVAEVTVTIEA